MTLYDPVFTLIQLRHQLHGESVEYKMFSQTSLLNDLSPLIYLDISIAVDMYLAFPVQYVVQFVGIS